MKYTNISEFHYWKYMKLQIKSDVLQTRKLSLKILINHWNPDILLKLDSAIILIQTGRRKHFLNCETLFYKMEIWTARCQASKYVGNYLKNCCRKLFSIEYWYKRNFLGKVQSWYAFFRVYLLCWNSNIEFCFVTDLPNTTIMWITWVSFKCSSESLHDKNSTPGLFSSKNWSRIMVVYRDLVCSRRSTY